MNGAHLRFRFGRLAKKAGLAPHLSPHSLRHSYATHMLAAGKALPWVAEQLGHSSPRITLDHYAWAIPSENEGAADALDHVVPVAAQKSGTTGDHHVNKTVDVATMADQRPVEVQQNQHGSFSDETRIVGLEVITGSIKPQKLADKSTRKRATPPKSSGRSRGGAR